MKFQSSSDGSLYSWGSLWSLLSVALAALLLATLSIGWASSARADDDDDDFASRQVIVKLKPGVKDPNRAISAINDRFATRTIERFPGSKIYLLRDRKNRDAENLADRMESRDSRIVYAEPNYRTESPEGDPHRLAYGGSAPEPTRDSAPYRSQYAMTGALNLPEAHNRTRGKGTVVAVLDTGVQMGHPELDNRITDKRKDFIDGGPPVDRPDGKDNDRDGTVDEMFGHGTHVAGIVRLAAPQARIMPLRVLNSDGRGNVFVLAEAIRYADRNGADVINLSLGSVGESEFLDEVIEDAADKDDGGRARDEAVVVAAAGNAASNVPQYPAAGEDSLTITSVNADLNKSDFANYGLWVDVAAPGSKIHSLFPTDKYAKWSGTSMATPFVAGQAALIRSERQGMGSEKIGCLVKSTARPLEGDKRLGGHADAAASLPSNGAECLAGGDSDDGGDD